MVVLKVDWNCIQSCLRWILLLGMASKAVKHTTYVYSRYRWSCSRWILLLGTASRAVKHTTYIYRWSCSTWIGTASRAVKHTTYVYSRYRWSCLRWILLLGLFTQVHAMNTLINTLTGTLFCIPPTKSTEYLWSNSDNTGPIRFGSNKVWDPYGVNIEQELKLIWCLCL